MVGKVHLQRHHPLRARHLRIGGRRGTERRRARRVAATVPPTPRCLPRAARRGSGLFAHAEACGFGQPSRHRTPISGSINYRVLTRAKGRCECCGAGCCLATPASKGPGGGPHRAQEPWRLGRPQQPAGPLLPLQCRQARWLFAYARGLHRLPRPAGQLRPSPGRLRVLRAGGQRPDAAGERTGVVHRRCRSGDAWAQPGDPAAAWG